MNEHYFNVTFEDETDVRYGYIDYGTLVDVECFARTMSDSELITKISLGDAVIVTWHDNDEHDVANSELYWDLTHWEVNAVWWYGDDEDGDCGMYVPLGTFDSEDEATGYTIMLASKYSAEIAYDAMMLGADMITLDVRPASQDRFERGMTVLADGTVRNY